MLKNTKLLITFNYNLLYLLKKSRFNQAASKINKTKNYYLTN